MPPSNSILSYEDVRRVLDRALQSPKGLSVKLPSKGSAINFRQRCNKLRLLDRDASRATFEPEDPRHGVSPYDALIFSLEEDRVLIRRGNADQLDIEELI